MSRLSKFRLVGSRVEAILTEFDKNRLKLPRLSSQRLFPNFAEQVVRIRHVPIGPWSSPLIDVVMLVKIALCAGARTLLEVGSYRGYTALLLAEHLGERGGRLVTVDRDPRHGEAYRSLAIAQKIERRVGDISPLIFAADAPKTYDFIFIDAGHHYRQVKRDTEIIMPYLSDHGHLLWHDYANFGKFSKSNGVPEYLHELSERIPIAVVDGTHLGIHSPQWCSGEGARAFHDALLTENVVSARADPWSTPAVRG